MHYKYLSSLLADKLTSNDVLKSYFNIYKLYRIFIFS